MCVEGGDPWALFLKPVNKSFALNIPKTPLGYSTKYYILSSVQQEKSRVSSGGREVPWGCWGKVSISKQLAKTNKKTNKGKSKKYIISFLNFIYITNRNILTVCFSLFCSFLHAIFNLFLCKGYKHKTN